MTVRTFTFTVQAPAATRLENAIVGLTQAGQWAEFNTTWPSVDFWRQPSRSQTFLVYGHTGFWDATRKKAYFLGADYASQVALVVYDPTQDTGLSGSGWTRTIFSVPGDWPHTYDQQAYDQSRGIIYLLNETGSTAYTINVDVQPYALTASTVFGAGSDSGGMEFWPSLDSYVRSGNNGDLYRRTAAGAVSTLVASGGPVMGYHGTVAHNPVLDVLYWGGGWDALTRMDKVAWNGSAAVRTTMANPYRLYVSQTVAMCGDITGNLVVLNTRSSESGGPAMSRFVENGSTGAWSAAPSTNPPTLASAYPMGCALHGVTGKEVFMYLIAPDSTGNGVKCYLYRYS